MSDPKRSELAGLILDRYPNTDSKVIEGLYLYYKEVIAGNEEQNLTRFTSEADFFRGHLIDCFELALTGWVLGDILDLGSGCGVPGIAYSVIRASNQGGQIILSESEGRKAEFLERTCSKLGLKSVKTYRGRGENYLKTAKVETITSRAVGTVSKHWEWLGKCSTWNTMVLFKGPKWEEEWNSHESKKARANLQIDQKHEYKIANDDIFRSIIKLTRRK